MRPSAADAGLCTREEHDGNLADEATEFHLVSPAAVRAAGRPSAALTAWIAERCPACPRHAEVPIESVLPSGQVLHGRIDLLLETQKGWVLIDHKANPAPRARWEQVATEHGGQLSVYADALARTTGHPVEEVWLVLPVAAGAMRVRAGGAGSMDVNQKVHPTD